MSMNQFGGPDSVYIDSSLYRLGYLYASPLIDSTGAELPLLDTQQEISILRDCLRDARRRLYFKVDVATPQNLRTMATLGAVMIHYSGHGFPGLLAFENGRGEVHRLDAESLKTLFAAGGVQTKIVFVSACHSEAAGRKFVEAGVPHVIALNNRVSDSSSRIFAQNLYQSLFRGKKTVREAFEIAEQMVMVTEGGRPTDQKKFLLLPEDSPHDTIIFENAPKGRYIDETEPLAPNNSDKSPKYFVGRKRLMQQVFFCLGVSNNRCVTIRGDRGMGKTALASRCCEYMNERKIFDLIYFAPLRRRGASPNDDHNVLASFLAACMGSAGDEVHCMEDLVQVLLGNRGDILAKGNADRRHPSASSRDRSQDTHGGFKLMDTASLCQSNRYEMNERKLHRILFVIDGADDFVVDSSPSHPFGNETPQTANEIEGGSSDLIEEADGSYVVMASPMTSADSSKRQGLINLLGEILRRTENVKFLITSCNRLAGGHVVWQLNEPEKVISVERLSNRQSAELLVKMAPRGLKPSEMNSDNPAIALDTLSARPVLRELGGHPRAIAMFASFLTDKVLDDSEDMCNLAKDVLRRAQEWKEEFDPDSIPGAAVASNSISKDEFRGPPGIPMAVAVLSPHSNHRLDTPPVASVVSNLPTKISRSSTEISFKTNPTPQSSDHERRRSLSGTLSNGHLVQNSSFSSGGAGVIPTPVIVHPTLRPSESANVFPVASSFLSKDDHSTPGSGRKGTSGLNTSRSQPFLRNVATLTELTSSSPNPKPSSAIPAVTSLPSSHSSRSLHGNGNGHQASNLSGLEMEEARRVARAVIQDRTCAEVWARVSAVSTANGNIYKPPLTSVRWTSLVMTLSETLEEETKVTLDHPSPQSGDDEDALSVTLSRKLQREDVKFIGHKIRLDEAPVVQGKNRHDGRAAAIDYNIARSRFIVFCEEWWGPLLKTLRILKVEFSCREPMIIHGFLSRQRTEEKLLETGTEGVFILRFSESQKGHMVVSFTDKTTDSRSRRESLCVHHCLVDVNSSGLSIFFESGQCSYPTLEDLIMNCSGLRLLYPDVPKDQAFERVRAFRAR